MTERNFILKQLNSTNNQQMRKKKETPATTSYIIEELKKLKKILEDKLRISLFEAKIHNLSKIQNNQAKEKRQQKIQ